MNNRFQILAAENDERIRRLISKLLMPKGFRLTFVSSAEEIAAKLQEESVQIVVVDLHLISSDGYSIINKITSSPSAPVVIVISANGSIEDAVEAMKHGAFDYVTKPFDETRFNVAVERAVNLKELLSENRNLRGQLNEELNINRIIAVSGVMKELQKTIETVAVSNANIMVSGESGTGKELITRAIHENSHRKAKPFVAINCAAIPDDLLESELFGHEKGAFTGAGEMKIGMFEATDGGTLFLDEIGEMSLSNQAKILRAIEQKEFQRVGGTETIRTDVRFIAATNRDMIEAVRQGKFREDLYFRLNVFPISVPTLKERVEDIIPLARFFLGKFSARMGKKSVRFSPEAEKALVEAEWPGNIRELQNTIERTLILLEGNTIQKSDINMLPDGGFSGWYNSGAAVSSHNFYIPEFGFSLEEHEKDLLLQALKKTNNNKTKAAQVLGISRATLNYRLSKIQPGTEEDMETETELAQ